MLILFFPKRRFIWWSTWIPGKKVNKNKNHKLNKITMLESKNKTPTKQTQTSWWFQPIWKKNESKMGSSSPIFGVKIKHIFELSCHHLDHQLNKDKDTESHWSFQWLRSFLIFLLRFGGLLEASSGSIQGSHRRSGQMKAVGKSSWEGGGSWMSWEGSRLGKGWYYLVSI